jgi:hypothetical protein
MKTWSVFEPSGDRPPLMVYADTTTYCATCERKLFEGTKRPREKRWARGLIRLPCGFVCALVICKRCLDHPSDPPKALLQGLLLMHGQCDDVVTNSVTDRGGA